MKVLKYLVVIVASLFVFSSNVFAASSNFEPTINMQPDITENQLQILLGYKGEDVMAINHYFSWNSTYLTLLEVVPLENFTITKGNEVEDGVYRTINILGDSDYSFSDTNYALLVFEVTDKFKVGKKSDVIYYDYQAVGPNKNKLRHKGTVMTLQRDSNSQMLFLMGNIDTNLKIKYWFKQNYLIVVFIVLIIIALVVVIFNLPSKRKNEHREKEITKQTKEPTYIPKGEVSPYKIDDQVLNNIGGAKPPVDMSEAIVISDVNPFTPQQSVSKTQFIDNSVVDVPVASGGDLTQIKAIPQSDNYNTVIDAFSQTIVSDTPTEINENLEVDTMDATPTESLEQNVQAFEPIVTNEIQPSVVDGPAINLESNQSPIQIDNISQIQVESVPQMEMPVPVMEENVDDLIQEVNDNPENLTLFQPTNFEEKKEEVIDTLSFILVFFLASFLFTPFVKAAEIDPNMIRECIVGNIPYSKDYDLNNDYKVDVIDILLTKDLSNVKLDDEEDRQPGFIDFDDTIRPGKDETTTTTTKSWWPISTKTTTKKKTTVKRTTAKRTTTAKKTTTNKTTTQKTTTAASVYTVDVQFENARVDVKSQKVQKGSKAYFNFTPNTGYKYSSASCTNGAMKTWNVDSKKLTVSSIRANSTCTINFVPRTDMKVIVNVTNGKSEKVTVKGTYLESGSIAISPKTGYQYKSISCNKVKASYNTSGKKVIVESLIDDDTCSLEFEPIPYKFTVKYGSTTKTIDSYYGETITYMFETSSPDYKKVKCVYNGTSRSFTLTPEQVGNSYKYQFSFKVTKDTTCTLS